MALPPRASSISLSLWWSIFSDEGDTAIYDTMDIARLPEQFLAVLEDLRALVNVDCGTANKADVDTVGRIFRQRLLDIGCELTEYLLAEYGDYSLATVR